MIGRDPAKRFSDRVEFYDRCRPSYPEELLDVLGEEGLLSETTIVADLGAGTGKLTRLLLDRGHRVLAVEPNGAMREVCELRLGGSDLLRTLDGTAEATTLPDASVDLVTVAQAFHWFDQDACRRECLRILRPLGGVAIVWNVRRMESTPFMIAYEALLREHGTDYGQVSHRGLETEELDRFFGAGRHRVRGLTYQQSLDREGLRGRMLSASYLPAPGDPGHEALEPAVVRLFDAHAVNGEVVLEYDTFAYLGRLRD